MQQLQRNADVASASQAPASRLSDREICDAYLYLLGRLLVLRQEHLELQRGFDWNKIVHRDLGAPSWETPNLDLAASEAWVAVDEASATILEVPPIRDRYYTIQVINLWGETIANINERNIPAHPTGTFAFCLRGAKVALPPSAHRIDLTGRKARIRIRLELGASPSEAFLLQHRMTMRTTGTPAIPATLGVPIFTDDKLPGVEVFDTAMTVLASEPDANPGMEVLQSRCRTIAVLAREAERTRITNVIREQQWNLAQALYVQANDWVAPRIAGNYGSDWLGRTAANFYSMWANTRYEVASFVAGRAKQLHGDSAYLMRFEPGDTPGAHARYFWSINCVDSDHGRVIPNANNRFVLNPQSRLQLGGDGSLTLFFAPRLPPGAQETNWLPTPIGRNFQLTWRAYGPDEHTALGRWFPPALQPIGR